MFSVVENTPSCFASVSLHRDTSAPEFQESDLDLLRFLVPHLQRAFSLHVQISRLFCCDPQGRGLRSIFWSRQYAVFPLTAAPLPVPLLSPVIPPSDSAPPRKCCANSFSSLRQKPACPSCWPMADPPARFQKWSA